jgi:hypothetical protein
MPMSGIGSRGLGALATVATTKSVLRTNRLLASRMRETRQI